jgi:diadenosine tetraphosphate (Ap4A) HIT family hydrolase
MTDLEEPERTRLMRAVFATERALRETLAPDKVNLASLGNAVPHVHWHVIPRFRDDRHFPAPVWAAPAREAAPVRALDRARLAARLAALL